MATASAVAFLSIYHFTVPLVERDLWVSKHLSSCDTGTLVDNDNRQAALRKLKERSADEDWNSFTLGGYFVVINQFKCPTCVGCR